MNKQCKFLTGGASGNSIIKYNDSIYKIGRVDNLDDFNKEIKQWSILYEMFEEEKFEQKRIYKLQIEPVISNPIIELKNNGKCILPVCWISGGNEYVCVEMPDLNTNMIELDKFICDKETDDTVLVLCLLNLISIVEFMTTKKVYHCDMHTGNIFVNPKTGLVKLIDFGLTETNKNCKQYRSMTLKLSETADCVFGKKQYLNFVLNKIVDIKLNSDVAMLLEIFMLVVHKICKDEEVAFNVLDLNCLLKSNGEKKLLEYLLSKIFVCANVRTKNIFTSYLYRDQNMCKIKK
jgi:serine/threonine protein kinase